MASAEMQLVCKIIKSGELKRALEWGVTADDFLMLETKAIFQQLLATFMDPDTSGSVLGPRLAQEKFTQLNLNDVDDHVTIEHLCKEVRQRRISKEIKEGMQLVLEHADVSPLQALSAMQLTAAAVMRLDAGRATDVPFDVGMEDMFTQYHRVQNGELVGKFIWPWGPLQDETQGGQDDDYIVFYGRPKSMKSWVLCFLIAWMVSNENRVLVYTKEMTTRNIYKRIAACLAGLPYDDVRRGRLTPDQVAILKQWVDIAKAMAGTNRLVVLSAKDVAGRDTVSWLRSKVDKYLPDVVFVDGLYLMSPENQKLVKTNDRVESISRAMRAMILDTKTPAICTLQANRKAAGHENAEFDEIAFSDSISQDCTMAIRVIRNKHEPTISLVFAGAREINFPGMSIKGIPCTNFDFHSLLTDKDVQQAKKADDPEEEETNKKGGGRSPRTANKGGPAPTLQVNKSYQAALKNL